MVSRTAEAQVTSYSYDVLGNLTTVHLPAGTNITYVADALNRRVGKKINGVLQSGFLYDGARLVAQLDGGSQVVSQFVYGTGRTSPDVMIRGGVSYRVFSDQLGSPRLVVDSATGAIAQRMDYDEFGNVINDTNPGFQPFGFAGGLYDPDTKLVRFGARDYDPTLGRWTAKDPILFGGGDTNLYGYVLNDPVNMVDPSGLAGECTVCKDKKIDLTQATSDSANKVLEQEQAAAPFTPPQPGSVTPSSSSSGPSMKAPSVDVGGGMSVSAGAGSIKMTGSLPRGTGQGSLEFNAKDLTVTYSQPVKLGNSGIKGDITVEVNGKEKNLTVTFCEN
jgi:RHS repeat-associated protein